MNTLLAYQMAESHRGDPFMVFDWDKAAQIIREKQPKYALAGLRYDWEYTGGIIYENGKPIKECDTFLQSNWAIPELMIDGAVIECYKLKKDTPGWGPETKWPESALKILEG